LTLGISLVKHSDESMSGTGPFGTHLSLIHHYNHWRLQLTDQHRQLDHEAQYGSGYSTLFARHVACNSLPLDLGEGEGLVRSIHVGPDFVEWVRGPKFAQAVKNLKEVQDELEKERERLQAVVQELEIEQGRGVDQRLKAEQLRAVEQKQALQRIPEYDLSPLLGVPHTAQELRYLSRLPAAYNPDVYCYIPPREDVQDWNDNGSESEKGNVEVEVEEHVEEDERLEVEEEKEAEVDEQVKEEGKEEVKEDGRYTLHWFKAVAGIAFGGLVPQAGKFMINAVLFTVTGEKREDCEHYERLEKDKLKELEKQEEQRERNRGSDSDTESEYVSTTNRRQTHSCATASRAAASRKPSRFPSYRRQPSSVRTQTQRAVMAPTQVEPNQAEPENNCSILTMTLQHLVDALHKDCLEFKLFGNYVEKRVRGELKVTETDCSIPSTPCHAGALFNRYMTALERLVAMSLLQEQDVANAPSATNATNGASTTGAANAKPQSDEIVQRLRNPESRSAELEWLSSRLIPWTETSRLPPKIDPKLQVKKIYEKCAELLFTNFGDKENATNLKADVDKVVNKIGTKDHITVEDCANVARCIIASWALRVPFIKLEWEASGQLANAAFHELPSVLAFGT
jgi:hypothetical protein